MKQNQFTNKKKHQMTQQKRYYDIASYGLTRRMSHAILKVNISVIQLLIRLYFVYEMLPKKNNLIVSFSILLIHL